MNRLRIRRIVLIHAAFIAFLDAVCLPVIRGRSQRRLFWPMRSASASFITRICALLRKPAAGSFLIHTACALLGAINYFVTVFRGTPVLPWDLTALNTALAVSSTYDFTPNGPMIVTAVPLTGFLFKLFCAFASLTFCPARSPRAFRCRYG